MSRAGIIALLAVGGFVAGCVSLPPKPADDVPPWKVGASGEVSTAAPDAGGPLSFRNCPTLAEASAAIPVLVAGPDANAVPYKTTMLTCSYGLDELDMEGHRATVLVSVLDASVEGPRMWDRIRTDPAFPNATDLPDLADVAFTTGTSGHHDVWVVEGDHGVHIRHDRVGDIPLDQMVTLARAVLDGLDRAPR